MAIMYAIPALTTWDASTVGGWSNTSGGASNGAIPDQTIDVIFDVNSGSARTINNNGAPACRSINTTGAAQMTFSTSQQVLVSANITGCHSGTSISYVASPASVSLTTGGVVVNAIGVNVSTTLVLQDDLTMTGTLTLGTSNSNVDANNKNVTLPSVLVQFSQNVTMGSGTWTLTGVGTVWDNSSSGTFSAGTSTIKITDTSASAKTIAGASKTYYNVWHAGAGDLVFPTTMTVNNIKANAGASLVLPATNTLTVASVTLDGTGAPISIKSSTSGTSATLAKSGGGTAYVDYCSIKDIAASPASTFYARNSTNVSGNTNWTFIPGNSRFLSFF
jgi:hypothetical protein